MTTLTLNERVPIEPLNQLINSANIDSKEKQKLKNLKRNVGKAGEHSVTYILKEKITGDEGVEELGRFSVKNKKQTLATLKKEHRAWLFKDTCVDLDMRNSNPRLLSNICRKNEFDCPKLNEYICNRQTYIDSLVELGVPRDKAKAFFLKMYSGPEGCFTHFLTEWNITECPQFFIDYNQEALSVRRKVLALAAYSKHVKVGLKSRPSNAEGSAMSYLLFDTERQVTMCAIDELQTKGYDINTYIYDGFLVRKKDDTFPESDLRDIEAVIKEKLDFDVTFCIKEPDYDFDALGVNDSSATDFELPRMSPSQVCINSLEEWAEEHRYYRMKLNGGGVSCLASKSETPYWAEQMYESDIDIVNGWFAWLGETGQKDLDFVYKNNFVSNQLTLRKVLEHHQTTAFPFVEYDWRFFGYSDGVFDIQLNKFVPAAELGSEQIFCRNYFDVPFRCAVSPALETVLDFQDFSCEMKSNIYALLGRAFYPIKQNDDWQLFPVIQGVPDSGKSTLTDFIHSCLRTNAVGTITSGTSKAFALEGKDKSECLVVSDANSKMNEIISDDNMKLMPCGQMVDVNCKGIKQKTVVWKVQLVICANEGIGYTAPAFERRFAYVYFNNKVPEKDKDTSLKDKILKQAPGMLPFIISEYHKLRDAAEKKGGGFWNVCCAEITANRIENAAEQNPLIRFLGEGRDNKYAWVEQRQGNKVLLSDFKKAYRSFLKGNDLYKKDYWNKISSESELKSLGFPVQRNWRCKSCDQHHLKGCCEHWSKTNKTDRPVIHNMVLHSNIQRCYDTREDPADALL